MKRHVTTYYLSLVSREQFRGGRIGCRHARIVKSEVPSPSFNRYFFMAVGSHWHWTSRLGWSYDDWQTWLGDPDVHSWYGTWRGTPFGYFELQRQGNRAEIVFFGLLPEFVGRGLGAYLLTHAVWEAWQLDVPVVWVHTCSLDHPHALRNYLDRGFSLDREETRMEEVPAPDDSLWLGPAFHKSCLETFARAEPAE
jgi:GNAT superfamily N-acetyltransferase